MMREKPSCSARRKAYRLANEGDEERAAPGPPAYMLGFGRTALL
jgi:hypothetical protein